MFNASYMINDNIQTTGKADYHIYNSTNKFTNGIHEIRDTTTKTIYLPCLVNADRSIAGVFDQTVSLLMSYDKNFDINITVGYPHPTKFVAIGPSIFQMSNIGGTSRLLFTPHVLSEFNNSDPTKIIITLPELSHPIPMLIINITFNEPPTTGDTELILCRRF